MPKQAVQSFRSLCYVLPLIQKAAVIVGIDSSPRPTQSIEEDPIFPLLLQERELKLWRKPRQSFSLKRVFSTDVIDLRFLGQSLTSLSWLRIGSQLGIGTAPEMS